MKKLIILLSVVNLLIASSLFAQGNQPARLSSEKAGEIGYPSGQIAFIRNGDLWVMNADGSNQFKVVTAQNADGSISWAPDGKRIAFTRKGEVDLRGPDNLGGRHKVYDIFIGYIDTATIARNTNWWFRVTGEMGGRYPQWSDDGSHIVFTQDLNANDVNAALPNYQTAKVDTAGGAVHIFRTDYNNSDSLSVLMPTRGPNNQCAFVILQGTQSLGVGIGMLDMKTLTKKDLNTAVKMLPGTTAPAWSPDGKWIALVESSMDKQGIYIVNPALTEKYLIYKPTPGQALQTYPLSWSPNSKWITFATGDGALWIVDITGNGLKQLTGSGLNIAPAWSKNM